MSVKPPRPKSPPLNALRAFEAAARHQSFVLAAEELSVTPGAVSQHIKTLEDWAGQPLFLRSPNGVELTNVAHRLVPELERAFDHMSVATRMLRSMRPIRELSIATLPALAQLWLPQVLPALRHLLPDVNIRVTGLETPPVLKRDLFDLAIFYSPQETPSGQIILRDEIFPVCAPDMAGRIGSIVDLGQETLLSDLSWDQDWPGWAAAQSLDLSAHPSHFRYSLYALALAEARAGAGVLMGHAGLVDHDLAQGALVRLPFASVPTGRVLTVQMADEHDPELQDVIKLMARPLDRSGPGVKAI